MACDFTINFSATVSEVVDKARLAIAKAGGVFRGDIEKGNFTLSTPLGEIEGNYTTEEKAIIIHIEKKPMFIPCATIEGELKKYLG